jgi:hypothetical protein
MNVNTKLIPGVSDQWPNNNNLSLKQESCSSKEWVLEMTSGSSGLIIIRLIIIIIFLGSQTRIESCNVV